MKRLGQEVVPGEGGWCYEDMVYGGKVLARGLDTGAGDLVHVSSKRLRAGSADASGAKCRFMDDALIGPSGCKIQTGFEIDR